MECPYRGAELEHEDSYGLKEYIIYGNENFKLGDIYKCPNLEGFNTVEDVLEYIDGNENDLEEHCRFNNFQGWDEIVCESSVFNGFFYIDKNDILYEGYPC